MGKKKLSVEDVYGLCNENGWFSSGTISQYNKMLSMVDSECHIHDIALAIWLCTEDSYLEQIEHVLSQIERG